MKFLLMTTYDGATVLQVFILTLMLLFILALLAKTLKEIYEIYTKEIKEGDKDADNGKDL